MSACMGSCSYGVVMGSRLMSSVSLSSCDVMTLGMCFSYSLEMNVCVVGKSEMMYLMVLWCASLVTSSGM